jgi:hypothetical protein
MNERIRCIGPNPTENVMQKMLLKTLKRTFALRLESQQDLRFAGIDFELSFEQFLPISAVEESIFGKLDTDLPINS